MSMYRDYPEIREDVPPSLQRMFFEGAPLKPEMQEQVDELIQKKLDEFEVPFDEIYHKEMRVVDQVVKAHQLLKDNERALPDPFTEDRKIRPGDVPEDILEEKGLSA